MIGINIRGIRHLWRMSGPSLRKALIRFSENGYDICEVIKSEKDNPMGERLFIFNNHINHHDYSITHITQSCDALKEELKNLEHSRIFEITKNYEHDNFSQYAPLMNEIVLLPQTFDDDYSAFLKENAKMIKSLTSKFGFRTNETAIRMLYIYTEGSKNFFQWAVGLYYQHNVSMRTIRNILTWNTLYKQLTKNLTKGTITAYNTAESIVQLLDELSTLRNEKRINDAINSFNTAQKKILRSNELSNNDKKTLSAFSKLSDVKRINFIKKASTIDDFKELMRLMRHVTSTHFDWNKESFMDFINNVDGINYETILDNGNVILVKVNDYETIKQLAKTTNWCISKNKTYWNNYIEGHHGKTAQYMIFDFSKLEDDKFSIIGFTTTHNKGITSAHDFVNDNLMTENRSTALSTLKSYLARFDKSQNIYTIMQNCGIDINLVANYDKPLYKWDRKCLMDYLYECVNADNVDIIKSDGDKLVLSVRDKNIRYFFGDAYIDNISSDHWKLQHIIFIDFSCNKYDPNKVKFAIIGDGGSDEDYPLAMFNEASCSVPNTFDCKLVEYDVPYDIIRRANNETRKLRDSFLSMNVPMIKSCLAKDSSLLKDVLLNHLEEDEIYDVIRQTTMDYMSFDYLDILYNNNYCLCEFIGECRVSELMKNIFLLIRNINRHFGIDYTLKTPNENDIDKFFKEELPNRDETSYVGYYLILKKLLEKEKPTDSNYSKLYSGIIDNMLRNDVKGSMVKELLLIMHHNVPNYAPCDFNVLFIKYSVKFGDDELLGIAKAMGEESSTLKREYDAEIERKGKISAMSISLDVEEMFERASVESLIRQL